MGASWFVWNSASRVACGFAIATDNSRVRGLGASSVVRGRMNVLVWASVLSPDLPRRATDAEPMDFGRFGFADCFLQRGGNGPPLLAASMWYPSPGITARCECALDVQHLLLSRITGSARVGGVIGGAEHRGRLGGLVVDGAFVEGATLDLPRVAAHRRFPRRIAALRSAAALADAAFGQDAFKVITVPIRSAAASCGHQRNRCIAEPASHEVKCMAALRRERNGHARGAAQDHSRASTCRNSRSTAAREHVQHSSRRACVTPGSEPELCADLRCLGRKTVGKSRAAKIQRDEDYTLTRRR